MALIRVARTEDRDAIRELLLAAFAGTAEARLVERLYASAKVEFSLVAEDARRVLGFVLFSRIAVAAGSSAKPVCALAPLAVLPAYQRLGIGSALVSAGLQRLRESGISRVLVVGDPEYYARFGFVDASRYQLRCPFAVPQGAFMAIELAPGAFAGSAGNAEYGPEFSDLE